MEAFFIPAGGGQRFCVYHPARGDDARGSVLYVPPFAEEMNKSRRMFALQADAFSKAGCAALAIDLKGTGDSSGDFGDATWDAWLDDVALACEWLRERSPPPVWVWGLRGGCLLAAEALRRMGGSLPLLFWQPSLKGSAVLRQFLRLKVAGEMLGGGAGGAIDTLRRDLAEGRSVAVAGYDLAPALASGLERSSLAPPPNANRLEWLELSSLAAGVVPPASTAMQGEWQRAGWKVRSEQVEGPAFWQTTEIEEAPNLIDATLRAVLEPVAA